MQEAIGSDVIEEVHGATGPTSEGFIQRFVIDLKDIPWNPVDGIKMFDSQDPYLIAECSKINAHSAQDIAKFIYARIFEFKKFINPNIKKTELVLREYATLLIIKNIDT